MADDPTAREITQISYLREAIAELRAALERVVPRELYDVKHEALGEKVSALEEALTRRLAALEAAREKDAEQRRSDRRWLIGVVAVPVIIAVVQILIQLRGGG